MQPQTAIVRTTDRDGGGVAWDAVLAGAVAAAAISLILLALGSGLGLSAISPWDYGGASGAAIGIGAIVWLLLMAAVSAGLGGYVAGRLRPRWATVPTDETYFRDTAHGFLAWSVATILSAALLTAAATAMVGTTVKAAGAVGGAAAATVAGGLAASGDRGGDSSGYFVDMLFRSGRVPDAATDNRALRAEASMVLVQALAQGEMSAGDRTYLGQFVAQRTGLSQTDGEARVTQVVAAAKAAADAATAKAKAAADAARKSAIFLALWVFISLLLGAFCAAVMATVGGRQRDNWAGASAAL